MKTLPCRSHPKCCITFQMNHPNGERRVDKSKVMCKQCYTVIGYANGNTSNMHMHLKRHLPGVTVTSAKRKKTVQTVQTQLTTPLRPHFSWFDTSVKPALYEESKSAVVHQLSNASSVALTTDGWTSRATESYLTVTAHHMTSEWDMVNHVLQTRPIYDQHTSLNLAAALKEAVLEWNLERPECPEF